MRILHISSPKTWRGGEQQLMYLVEELNKIGVWQMVMCPFNSPVHKYCLKNHISHVTYFKGFSANPMVAFRVNHVCKRQGINLVHVHDSHAHNFAVLSAVLSKNDLPIVVSRRVDFAIQGGPISMFKYNHPQIKKILCVSGAIRDIMEPYIEEKSKLDVVYSGVDLEKFKKPTPTPNIREIFNISNDKIIVGNVAALAPHKDYPTFVRAAKRVIDAGVNAVFLAIGDGPSRKLVEQCIEQEGMQDHVVLTGFRTDVVELLPQLDLFLIPSETEGLGTSILDAQVAGVPIVATKAGGIVEIVKHNETGLMAEVKDDETIAAHVIELINNEDLRKKLVDNAKTSVVAFSKTVTAKKTKLVYESVLEATLGKPDKE